MRNFFRWWWYLANCSIDSRRRSDHKLPCRFWLSNHKGKTVTVVVPPYAEKELTLLFQRPLDVTDVKEGKLLSTALTRVKRRGGKRQTDLTLSLESADILYKVLGAALKEAHARQQDGLFGKHIVSILVDMERTSPGL